MRLYLFYLLVNIELLPRLRSTDLKHLQSFYPIDSCCTILYKRECWQPPPPPSPAGHEGLWLGGSEC